MNSEWVILGPAALYMMSMTLTPGPNNVMLTASGANFGFRRTLPHMWGILGGCFLLFAGIALGLGVLFERYPAIQTALRLGKLPAPRRPILRRRPIAYPSRFGRQRRFSSPIQKRG